MGVISYIATGGLPIYLVGIWMLVMLINTFFEYGLEIIAESSKGIARPPPLDLHFFNIFNGRGRFVRQMLMLGIFGGLSNQLFTFGLDYLALAVICFVALAFPASLAVNALYENLYEVINPLSLIDFALIVGKQYALAVAALAGLMAGFYLSAFASLGSFLVFLPLGLYGLLVYFRFLGVVALQHRDNLFKEPDYDAADNKIQEYYEDNARLHEVVENAYRHMQEKQQLNEAIALLTPVIQFADWIRFDSVFRYISAWPDKKPAIHFVILYLPVLMQRQNSMRALSLCQWCLQQEPDFVIDDEELLQNLVSASVSKEHYVVAVKLLDNFVELHPGHQTARKYLSRAADICQSKLHHQQKFDELQEKLDKLNPA